MIKEESGAAWQEMYRVFNMGHRMELYVRKEIADDIISIANSYNVEASVVGHCKASQKNELTIVNEEGTYTYMS